MKTVQAVLLEIKEKFRAAGIDSWEADARLLMQHATGLSREDLFIKQNEPLEKSREENLAHFVERRLAHEPVSRIVGYRSFWKSEFKISKETLDPRADSECLIEAALRHAPKPLSILDLGTGSGCLLLSLLQEWPQARGVGLDISEDAVSTARENAEKLKLDHRAQFICLNWNDFKPDRKFDIVISNPPYIAEDEIPQLAPEVRLYDPIKALIGGHDGLDCYENIMNIIPRLLSPDGLIFLEIGHTQAPDVRKLLEKHAFEVLETVADLGKNDRCIVARYKP